MTGREDVRKRLKISVTLIVQAQNEAGGWRYQPVRNDADLSVTVCQVMALRAARTAGLYVEKSTIDSVSPTVLAEYWRNARSQRPVLADMRKQPVTVDADYFERIGERIEHGDQSFSSGGAIIVSFARCQSK